MEGMAGEERYFREGVWFNYIYWVHAGFAVNCQALFADFNLYRECFFGFMRFFLC